MSAILNILTLMWDDGKVKRAISRRNMDRLEYLYALLTKQKMRP